MSDDETIVATSFLARPNPGGRLTPGPEPTAVPGAVPNIFDHWSIERHMPLVVAAVPLLDLCVRIRASVSHPDIEGLRLRVLREIDAFERRIVPLGLAPRAVRAAKYALCATIDDLVLNSPWGSRSLWTSRSMVSSLFSETWGGDRFFDLLTQLKKDPGVNVDLLELLYYCMSLGFEGKYRIAPRGAAELTLLREDVYRLIRAARGDVERDLSPDWRGAIRPAERLVTIVPLWVAGTAALGVLLGLYTLLALLLNGMSDNLFDRLATLPPTGTVSLARSATPPKPVVVPQSERLRHFLEPEIKAGLVTVQEDAQSIKVLIRGAGMFASGEDAVIDSYRSLLDRIGKALNDQPGDVLVTGHTDNVNIRTPAFPSNYQLSLARAKSVAAIITEPMRDRARVTIEGKGASEPIAPNDTTAQRALNRRIELILTKPN
ncbi:type VI secretion system protein ImpK [Arboricoccus pini]|uniref:Type VI secretion system protein ImpK n=1 Tax=Arboricoccus pini TaxID=1963835 RepID=A0A212RQC6_9PROT|nr:type IVB secretion system protein IcmH/DotU [Arboricoccus pini]SNB74741.1 type VI secretion system protein ImpK [Arboricoccus pini]